MAPELGNAPLTANAVKKYRQSVEKNAELAKQTIRKKKAAAAERESLDVSKGNFVAKAKNMLDSNFAKGMEFKPSARFRVIADTEIFFPEAMTIPTIIQAGALFDGIWSPGAEQVKIKTRQGVGLIKRSNVIFVQWYAELPEWEKNYSFKICDI